MSSRDYGYGHSYWKDQLTSWGSYGTNSFVYDDSGNPTKYKGKTLEWEGKRLTRYNESDMKYTDLSYDGNGLLAGYFYSNTYSIWGGATFTTTMTREILRDGDRILSEKVTEYNPETNSTSVKNIMYAYDEKGVSGMTVGGKKYYFVRNIFGDVTAIYNTSRVKCAEYAYDAWGTMYMTLDTEGVGSLNPFRYRGYSVCVQRRVAGTPRVVSIFRTFCSAFVVYLYHVAEYIFAEIILSSVYYHSARAFGVIHILHVFYVICKKRSVYTRHLFRQDSVSVTRHLSAVYVGVLCSRPVGVRVSLSVPRKNAVAVVKQIHVGKIRVGIFY